MNEVTNSKKGLERLRSKLDLIDGPFVIIGRPHSGTRPVASAFEHNHIYMGAHVTPGFLDSGDWYSFFVLPLITSPFFPHWPDLDASEEFRCFCETQLVLTLKHFLPRFRLKADAWGWKFSEALFVMPIIKYFFPRAKFVHMIRDGRDVVLSDGGYFQLTNAPRQRRGFSHILRKLVAATFDPTQRNFYRYDYRRFCMNISLGEAGLKNWKGIKLYDHDHLSRNRFLIQMQSWRYCCETARQYGKTMPDSYLELRYEDFCRQPLEQMQTVFRFLDKKMGHRTKRFLETEIRSGRIGKWKRAKFDADEKRDFDNAVRHGHELLERLGYTS